MKMGTRNTMVAEEASTILTCGGEVGKTTNTGDLSTRNVSVGSPFVTGYLD